MILVTDTLDEHLDLATFELTEIALGQRVIVVPPGLDAYQGTLNLQPEGIAAVENRTLAGKIIVYPMLHDIGLDVATLAHLAEGAAVVKALDEFGCFRDDGKTEFVPYWRSAALARFGEAFPGESAFALTETDPLAHVHLSVWRRPSEGKGCRALIVVVNEADQNSPSFESAVGSTFVDVKGFPGISTMLTDVMTGAGFTRLFPSSTWKKIVPPITGNAGPVFWIRIRTT